MTQRRLTAQIKAILGAYATAAHGGIAFEDWKAAMVGSLKSTPSGDGGEDWAEDDPELPRLERSGIGGMLQAWRRTRDRALRILGLTAAKYYGADSAKEAEGLGWVFDRSSLMQLLALGDEFTAATTSTEGALTRAVWHSWVRGWVNGAAELSVDDSITEALRVTRTELQHQGMELVRAGTARELRDKILADLGSGAYDGMNPEVVAEQLRRKFGAAEYNWERLARSEIAMAQSRGKVEMYEREGIERVDYVTAGDERVSTICRQLEASGPYTIAAAPIPVQDSHPNCRCTLRARID